MSRICSLVVLLTTALAPSAPGQTPKINVCIGSESIWKEILEAVNVSREKDGEQRDYDEVLAERRERVKALYAKYPDDFFVRRAYLTHSKYDLASEELIAEFKKLAEASPQDPGAQHLYAESLIGRRTPEALKILNGLIEKYPTFPWPYRSLVQIHESPAFSDRAKVRANAEAYVEHCAENPIAVHMAMRLDKSEKLAEFAKRARAGMAGRADSDALGAYSALWRLEFKLAAPQEQEPVRARVREDLKFLEGLDSTVMRDRRYVLEEGYKLTGDKEGLAKLAEGKGAGRRIDAYFRASEEFHKKSPPPGPQTDPGEREEFNRKLVKFLDEWIAQLPNEDFLAVQKLQALTEIKDTPDADVIAEGERALRLSREKKPVVFGMLSTASNVAQVWAKRGVELDRVVALVEEGEAATAKREQRNAGYRESDLYATPSRQLDEESGRWYRATERWATLAQAHAKMRNSADARAVLAIWENELKTRRQKAAEIREKQEKQKATPATSGQDRNEDEIRRHEDRLVKSIGTDESRYYAALAELAKSEKRNADALSIYQASLRSLATSPYAPSDLTKSEPGMKARELWKETGGTNEGWQLWVEGAKPSAGGAKETVSKWSAVNRALKDFTVSDLGGASWTAAKVKGKTTLINVWATWCGPCRSELPHLQKLHDQIKAREDVQVITLNVDDNSGLVEPFMKENKFSFPVLFAREFVDDFTGPLGIPTNWISDRGAKLRAESVGFGGDGEQWIKNTLEEMERIRESPGGSK